MVHVNVQEIRTPEIDAQLVAESIAQQIEKRISYKRAMKQSVFRGMRMGAKGMRVRIAGRLGGAEMARVDGDKVRQGAASYPESRHRLRLYRGEDDLRPYRH